MSVQAVHEFRKLFNSDPAVREAVRQGFFTSSDWKPFVAAGSNHGFQFTDSEAKKFWCEIQNDQMSDLELEVVAVAVDLIPLRCSV